MAGLHKLLGVCLLFVWCEIADAQIITPVEVQRMTARYKDYFDESPRTKMYQITIFLTRNRRELETQQQRAKTLFRDMEIDWVYDQPYYYLRTGRYLNERQAWPEFYRVRKEFPNAIINIQRILPEDYFED